MYARRSTTRELFYILKATRQKSGGVKAEIVTETRFTSDVSLSRRVPRLGEEKKEEEGRRALIAFHNHKTLTKNARFCVRT